MPDSLMFVKKGGRVFAFAFSKGSELAVFDEDGYAMLSDGANDQENFDNTVAAYTSELVSEGYVAAAKSHLYNMER